MQRGDLDDLALFSVVAAEASFTRAAARLGLSQSALSRAMKALEDRLGVRLLSRTTRSVSPTEAGEALLARLDPALETIRQGLSVLEERRETPAGTVRLTMVKHAAMSLIRPILPAFLAAYPHVRVDITLDDGFADIVAGRFDGGIRFAGHVDKDMIGVRVGPEMRAAVVGSADYFQHRPVPVAPDELAGHRCINYRLATSGGIYPWAFETAGRRLDVRVDGALTFNDADLIQAAALDGQGLAYLFEDQVGQAVADGRLIRVLDAWCPPFAGYYLYHPGRRQTPPALTALIETLLRRRRGLEAAGAGFGPSPP